MSRRLLFRTVIPAAALALTGAIASIPASAASDSWQIATVTGDPTLQSQFNSAAASGPDNAWATGFACSDAFCSTEPAIAEQWNGQAWQAVALPAGLGGTIGPYVATSSADNTWVIADDASQAGYAVHITSSGMTEDTLPTNGEQFFPAAAATFSSTDAWAFGGTEDPATFQFLAYAAHYDGQQWTQMPVPVQPLGAVSALSSDNLWILGQTPGPKRTVVFWAAQWNGSGWATVPLPKPLSLGLPAGVILDPVGILALNDHDVWVIANRNPCPPCGVGTGALLLHWNGGSWRSLAVPATVGSFDADMASDGQGGFWVSGFTTGFAGPYLYHFSNDHWSSQLAPTQDGERTQLSALASVPGTTSLFGAGSLNSAACCSGQAAIFAGGG